jgi:hypothetical protein
MIFHTAFGKITFTSRRFLLHLARLRDAGTPHDQHLREWLFHSRSGVGVGVTNYSGVGVGVGVGAGLGANNLSEVDSKVDFSKVQPHQVMLRV